MRDADEAIDRLLAGLGDVEAPVGMERRVLAAMESRAMARKGSTAARWVWAGGVVGAAVAAGVLMLRPAAVPVRETVAQVSHVQRPQEPARNTGILRSVRNDRRPARVALGRTTAPVTEVAQEPGFPAPPMPLTEEEKLLLRMAHRADPELLTPLNAEARERQAAAFDQEFMEFFAGPDGDEQSDPAEKIPTEKEKGEAR